MISHKFRFVYCHIPRTGGTSFTEYLRIYCTKRSNLGKESGDFIEISHTPMWRMKKLYFGQDLNFDDYFNFTIVRNPYDRIVSLFEHNVQNRENIRWKANFSNLLAELDNDAHWKELMRFRYGQAIYWPAKFYLTDRGKPMFDYVVPFERMHDILPGLIRDKLGIRIPEGSNRPYPHVNKTERRPYQGYYRNYEWKVIQKRYGWELEEFGYEF